MLNDTDVRNAKPRGAAYQLFDERALFRLVSPSGARRWRVKYRINGCEKLIALGAYASTAGLLPYIGSRPILAITSLPTSRTRWSR